MFSMVSDRICSRNSEFLAETQNPSFPCGEVSQHELDSAQKENKSSMTTERAIRMMEPMATIRGFAPQLLPRSTTCGARFGKLWSEKRISDLTWSVRRCQIVLFTKCKNETMRPIRVFLKSIKYSIPKRYRGVIY